jgi:hypothetical protein
MRITISLSIRYGKRNTANEVYVKDALLPGDNAPRNFRKDILFRYVFSTGRDGGKAPEQLDEQIRYF